MRSQIDMTPDLTELVVYLLTSERVIAAQNDKWLLEVDLGNKGVE